MRKRNHRRQPRQLWPQFSLLDEMAADPIRPLSIERRQAQVEAMRRALDSLAQGANPTAGDWRICSDAVNITETLVKDMAIAQDAEGLLQDAVAGLAASGQRQLHGKPLRLDGPGLQAVRAVIEDYEELIAALPARTVIRAHRLTERRVRDILEGRGQHHDIEVIDINTKGNT